LVSREVPGRSSSRRTESFTSASYTPFGRATKTFVAFEPSKPDVDLVAKVSWPEVSRENEAPEKGKDDEHTREHLPTVICSADFEGTDTGCIRTALELDVSGSGSGRRVLRIIIFQRLQDILLLQGKDFVMAGLCPLYVKFIILSYFCFPAGLDLGVNLAGHSKMWEVLGFVRWCTLLF
jgi:hypothetical protein